jgi:hypothetical protein
MMRGPALMALLGGFGLLITTDLMDSPSWALG